jgi:DNA-binding CsgD family transcriptional regulator
MTRHVCLAGEAPGFSETEASGDAHRGAWFDCDPAPVFIIGPGALLLQANAAAREVLQRREIELTGGRLSFVDVEARRGFAAAVIRVLSEAGGPQTLVLRTNDGQWRRVTLRRSPTEPACAFLALGPGESDGATLRALWKAFGLSPAEREVLHLLVEGNAPKEIAQKLGLSTYTVRAHLRNLYLKAHVRGISGLIRECSRLSA